VMVGAILFGGALVVLALFLLVIVLPILLVMRGRFGGVYWRRPGAEWWWGSGWRQSADWRPERRQFSPEAILDGRFARGEISRAEYQEALIEILKGRYVRSELTLDDYESRLSVLIGKHMAERGSAPTGTSQLSDSPEHRPLT
jgi:hypothetical protein